MINCELCKIYNNVAFPANFMVLYAHASDIQDIHFFFAVITKFFKQLYIITFVSEKLMAGAKIYYRYISTEHICILVRLLKR